MAAPKFVKNGPVVLRNGVFLRRITPALAEEALASGTAVVSVRSGRGLIAAVSLVKRSNEEFERSVLKVSGRRWESNETVAAASLSRLSVERRRLEANALGSHTEQEWQAVLDRTENRCAWCGIHGDHAKLTKDHIEPLAQGGTNYISNLQPLCQSCNSRKGNRDVDYRPKTAGVAATLQ